MEKFVLSTFFSIEDFISYLIQWSQFQLVVPPKDIDATRFVAFGDNSPVYEGVARSLGYKPKSGGFHFTHSVLRRKFTFFRHQMLVFCPYCGSMLQIEEGDSCMQFSCPSCPYVCPVTKKVSSRIYPKLKDLEEVLGGPSVWDNAQVTNERCPKCSHERAYFMQIQTRSADEPMTIFYRCANAECAHRWKD
ncbi:unnamed protein product [Strongylus vulgaris]|uniref:DNA-directed RNA polymerase III subunit RPC10 n=1 Tax=Strongylus vulgaris TaxID=40348 RepID=A0A3P7KF98_STRVU|nr:unnamed protein product [Strongylus vulgaris]